MIQWVIQSVIEDENFRDSADQMMYEDKRRKKEVKKALN